MIRQVIFMGSIVERVAGAALYVALMLVCFVLIASDVVLAAMPFLVAMLVFRVASIFKPEKAGA